MMSHAKAGQPTNHRVLPQASQPGKSAKSPEDASDLITVADILRAIGMSSREIASSPELSYAAALNLCRLPKTRGQPTILARKSNLLAQFPHFINRMEPHTLQKPTTYQTSLAMAIQCAPSRSLPAPISMGPPKHNIRPAKSIYNKFLQPVGSSAITPAAAPAPAKRIVPTKAPPKPAPSLSPQLARALEEGSPSSFNPYVEGPYTTSNTAKTMRFLATVENKKQKIIERLVEEYLNDVKKQVALNGLHGKEELVVPDYVYDSIVQAVYSSEFMAPQKQLGALKIKKSTASTVSAAMEKKEPTGSPTTPVTPVTPVTPLVNEQLIRASTLNSQDSINSTASECNESKSEASAEKTAAAFPSSTSATEDSAAIRDEALTRPQTVEEDTKEEKEVVSMLQQVVEEPVANKQIIEDDDEVVSFSCEALNMKRLNMNALKKGIKYPYLVIRGLLRKKKAAKGME